MDKESTKDKNIKKKKIDSVKNGKAKNPKTKVKAKVKAKSKPRQTQTQSQKVIVNLQDVKRRRTKTRRTRATPQQPQVIYQQAPMPPQQDLNSIVRDQLSRLVPQQAPQPEPLPVPQPVPQPEPLPVAQAVPVSVFNRPAAERRVEQVQKPELVKSEMPRNIRDFIFPPANIDRLDPLRRVRSDSGMPPGNIDRLDPVRRVRSDSGMPLGELLRPPVPEEVNDFKPVGIPQEANDFKPVGIPQEVGPIISAMSAAEEPEEDNESLVTSASSKGSELRDEDNVSDATSASSEGSELQEEDNKSEGSEVSEGFERSGDKETRLLEEQIILENELRNAEESVAQITQRNNTGNLKGADKKQAAAELREAKSNKKEKQDRLKILKKELKQVMQETSVSQLAAPQATAKPSQKGKGAGASKSDETKARMAAAKQGKTLTPETKAKMAKSQTGQVKSKETKAKTAASLEAYNAERKAGTFV